MALMTISAGLLLIVSSAQAMSPYARMEKAGSYVTVGVGSNSQRVSIASPEFVFYDETIAPQLPRAAQSPDLLSGKRIDVSYSPVQLKQGGSLEVRLCLQWSAREAVLRKWARYRITGTSAEPLLKEIILDRLPVKETRLTFRPSPPQSAPAFWAGGFAGIEFPVASTRTENGDLVLAQMPGLRLQSEAWYESHKAIYGIAPAGQERQAFRRYIELHHPSPKGIHINYNSWWTSPVPYKEADIERLMGVFENKLAKPYGASFDTFCIDMGWSTPKSAWEIDKQLFPQGFTGISEAARRMGCNLGLWISPSSCYSPAMDNEWAEANGFETYPIDSPYQKRCACLAGQKYRAALTKCLVDAVTKYGVRHIKLDGYTFACPASNHGHEPGPLSADAVAAGFISVMNAVHKANKDVWLEPTCFGPNPSPWWLFYANSVTGFFGDDCPYGRVPSPVYRESYSSARDYFNLQGSALLPLPISGQDTLGLVHQSPEPFTNDAVMCVMRGNMFIPVYVNPRFMDDGRWKALAGVFKWARENASILAETRPLLPAAWKKDGVPSFSYDSQMPREPYGYAHPGKSRSLVVLRNPWIAPQTYSLRLADATQCSSTAEGISAVSLYPEPRIYGKNLKTSDTLSVRLAPYETVVLSISTGQSLAGLPGALDEAGKILEAVASKHEIKSGTDSVGLKLEASAIVNAPGAQMLVLLEDKKAVPASPVCRILVNSREAAVVTRASIDVCRGPDDATDIGWAASSLTALEHWRFISVPLGRGKNSISVDLSAARTSCVSAWIWANKPGGGLSAYPNALPQPELLSLDGAQLLAPTDLSTIK